MGGREIKGLFQATKQNFLYALDREMGEPIWPIVEQSVPASNVPGEQLSPTQPFPTRPAPYDLQGRSEEDLIDYTPEVYQQALRVAQDGNLFNSNHPLLQGVEGVEVNRGRGGHSAMVASPTLLFASGQTADGTWSLFAIDKETGERLGAVDIPGSTRYGMSSWMHEGKQYIIIQLNNGLAAMALP